MRGVTKIRPGTIPTVLAAGALVAIAAVAVALADPGSGVALFGAARRGGEAASTADVVRATERRRLQALLKHDYDTAAKLHADDFELIDPLGETVSKEGYLGSGNAFAYTIWKPITPIRVRVHGDSAVIRYESDLEIHGSRGHFWHTDLYEKRHGRWQIVWSQTTAAI
jgi:hypothetical protein